MDKYETIEKFFDIEEEYIQQERAIRYAKKKGHAKPKSVPAAANGAMLSDPGDDTADWVPTYAAHLDPKHHEREWVIESLSQFYHDNVITDVTRRVKGGKEANVYCCPAHPAAGVELIAAKLYRPRMLRTLKNDAIYKAGRELRDEEGKTVKGRRDKLAIRQKSTYGKYLDMVWWIGNEFGVQKILFEAGADVPRPIAHNGNTILMDYVGDAQLPAPTLSDITLDREEAAGVFEAVLDNIKLMLEHHCVHSDLSAFNILYWEGEISIIDFPQVVNARTNPHAQALLQRDIKRICDYFRRYKVESNAAQIAHDLWIPYMGNS